MTVITKTRLLLAGAAVAATAATLAVALPATAATQSAPTKVTAHSYYLALGDSVSFGYREADSAPKAPVYTNAANFVAYPALVGRQLGLKVANAACPGETSSSLNSTSAQSNGCESAPGGGPGYRTAYPLHETYTGTQLAYAQSFLKSHPSTRLVTLMIGANDGFLCQETTTDQCTSSAELTALVTSIEKNVATTLKAVRGTGYTGQIVVVNYYSTDYSDALKTAQSQVINNALDTGASKYGVTVANGFKAFRAASQQADLSTCGAGLLTYVQGGTTCGTHVHPSLTGQYLLAGAVESAIKK